MFFNDLRSSLSKSEPPGVSDECNDDPVLFCRCIVDEVVVFDLELFSKVCPSRSSGNLASIGGFDGTLPCITSPKVIESHDVMCVGSVCMSVLWKEER